MKLQLSQVKMVRNVFMVNLIIIDHCMIYNFDIIINNYSSLCFIIGQHSVKFMTNDQ